MLTSSLLGLRNSIRIVTITPDTLTHLVLNYSPLERSDCIGDKKELGVFGGLFRKSHCSLYLSCQVALMGN